MTSNDLIQTLDFDELLYKLNKGESLSVSEIDLLTQCITTHVNESKKKRSLEDLYSALKVVSKTNMENLSYLAEMCLDVHDPILVSLALETLIFKWKLGIQFEERLIQFALGVPWDYDNDIRESSIKCIGEHLLIQTSHIKNLKELSPTLLRLINLLLGIAVNKDEDEFVREAAYDSLASVLSKFVKIQNKEKDKSNFMEDNECLLIKKVSSQLKSLSSFIDSNDSSSDKETSETGIL